MKLILATKNSGKVRELSQILKSHEIITMTEAGYEGEIEETGKTFEENALIKARAVCESLGLPAVADDSGLEVYALGMRPGIYSARYAGENTSYDVKIKKLLEEMEGKNDRRARFVCCAAICFPGGKSFIFKGEIPGSIALSPKGENGFGYDPVFLLDDGRTMAQLTNEEKNKISHRYRAFQKLSEFLEGFHPFDKN